MPGVAADKSPGTVRAGQLQMAGYRELYESLVRDFSRPVFDYIWHMIDDRATAEDLTQDVFVRALVGIGGLVDPARARSWVFAIATNIVRDHWRRRRLVRFVPLERLRGRASGDHRGLSDTTIMVQSALARLAREDREVMVLVGYCGCRAVDAAEVLGITPPAVQKRWQRAQLRFLELVAGEGGTR